MTCPNCEKAKVQPTGTYNFKLECCRTRFIQAEPCKYLRKVLVDFYRPRYGEFPSWQEGNNCGCERICKRKAAVDAGKRMEPIYEQSVNTNRKKTSRRR
jgi:hypothetical protein